MGLRTLVGQKTFSHLLGKQRMPSAYEVATSDLLYYVKQGFSVRTPVTRWYDRHQAGSPLRATDWEAFVDPAETTYASYTRVRATREVHAGELLRSAAEWDRALGATWRRALGRAFGVLRYPRHALMMAAGYVGSLAPSGRITVAAAFQTGDEVRHVHRIAERAAQLEDVERVAERGRSDWMTATGWQPLRALMEKLLTTYDWGEALAALNLVVKPTFDAVAIGALGARAVAANDPVTAGLLRSLDEDAAWQRAWTAALVDVAVAQRPENRDVLAGWEASWRGPAIDACEQAARAIEGGDMNPSLLAHVEAAYDGRDEAIAVLDESLRVRAWSAAMGALSGRAPEAARGVLLYDLYPQLWGTKTAQLLTDALHGEYGHIAEPFFAAATPAQAHAAEAFVAPLLAGGRVSGCLLRARNRSRTTAHEHEEASIDQRFRAMADAAPVLLWKAGTDSLCDFFNQTWLDFSGRRMEDELGVGWAEGVHPEDFQRCMNTYTRAFSARQPFEMEYRLRRRDGEYRWLLDRGVPRVGPDGAFLGFIGSCVDITDRIVAERAAQDLARDLGRANQQMEQLLYAASHDLHEPIRMVTSFLELLERHAGPALDDKAVRYLRFAREGGLRMGGLVDGLLTIARARSATPEMQPVDTRKLVDVVLGDLAPAVAGCAAQVQIGELPVVTGDPALLRSLLQNLLSNAIKFRSDAPPLIRIAAERRGDEWEFAVEDNGIGFRPEDAPRVFELFRRLHPRADRPGNGIGLALAREIVLRHGGRIWARSEVGKGATLSFSVPVVASPEAS